MPLNYGIDSSCPTLRSDNRIAAVVVGILLLLLLLCVSACVEGKKTVIQDDFQFDGSCVSCHAGLSAGQVHANYKLRCVDCHGGNDQVEVPDEAFEDEAIYRDSALLSLAHVVPKPGLARFFYGNGIDDDQDGTIDEGPEFGDDGMGGEVLIDFGEIAEPGLHGEGVGEFLDTEFNRDLNYTRWLNPGDLRVAKMSCGASSAASGGSGCHQSVVDTNRRSVMTNNSGVINGAYYGNESWRATFQNARDAQGAALDPRKGAFGYTFDYDGIDACIVEADTSAGLRSQPRFDSRCLEALAVGNDPNAIAGAEGNVASNVGEADLPAFEATQGSLGRGPGVSADRTVEHQGVRKTRFPGWGGKALKDPEASILMMQPVPEEELLPGIPDPIDLILRGFRAYFPLNFPGSARNQNAVFGETIEPNVSVFKTRNPFGRGHSMGCTSCHMKYNYDGTRTAQKIVSQESGERVIEEVVDPTTKHREFDSRKDIQEIAGEQRLVGMSVTTAEREFANVADADQQRMYSANHELTTRITTDTCGLCHSFVTRVNYSYTGMTEEEQRDPLARRKAIEFVSPQGDQVQILDSWIREETIAGVTTVVIPVGVEIVDLAKRRDKDLEALGLIPGWGGCVLNVFTEDCNNNGRLDTELRLQKVDENGVVLAETVVNEDLNGNGKLDLIDRLPREKSTDGRQVRYIYGGVNGATRLMDIHFERGMHCIDCHQLQDSHGDGHLYGTNHEVIEIECEDCHGSLEQRATLVTSGANGGNLMSAAVDRDGRPFFEVKGDKVIQRSRVTPGLTWVVPQLPDTVNSKSGSYNARAAISHSANHLNDVATDEQGFTKGSTYAGTPGESELLSAKLECYSCHTSWVLNCMGCHENSNLGDLVRNKLLPDGRIEKVAGENEVWFNNSTKAGATNFQLLAFMRSPFVLGAAASADSQRLAPFRSSMIVHASVNDAQGTIVDSVNFTTFQKTDGNSGRGNVATSGGAMNQTMPHTVRPEIVKSCEQCHSLVDQNGRIRNDHILGETMGLGASRYGFVGDWVMAAGGSGIELFEYKQENQFPGSSGSSRFPGIIVNAADRVLAAVEPILDGSDGIGAAFTGSDIVFIRNFNPTPSAPGETTPPSLKDIAVSTHHNGVSSRLLVSNLSGRGHPSRSRPSVGDSNNIFSLVLPDLAHALAHLAPDVSDPYVYVANGAAGITAIRINFVPNASAPAASLLSSVLIPGGAAATEIVLAGDIAYVGTDAGTVETFDLSDPELPVHRASITLDASATINGLALGAFVLYVGSSQGLGVLSIEDPFAPALASGSNAAIVLAGQDVRELSLASGHLYLAIGSEGIAELDVTTAANPIVVQNLVDTFAPGELVDIQDVLVSIVPGQTWVLGLDASGDLLGFKLENKIAVKERCLPAPVDSNCGLDMDFRDPTITGRDPSFDPVTGLFDVADPSGNPFFRQTAQIVSSGRRMARPAYFEKINTQTGRRVRDSFMPGSGTLSLAVMQRMYAVRVCENSNTSDRNGNGIGQLGFADSNFLTTGDCSEFGQEASAQEVEVGGICPDTTQFNAVNGKCERLAETASNSGE